MKNRSKGFSLIEAVTTITLICLISTIFLGFSLYKNHMAKEKLNLLYYDLIHTVNSCLYEAESIYKLRIGKNSYTVYKKTPKQNKYKEIKSVDLDEYLTLEPGFSKGELIIKGYGWSEGGAIKVSSPYFKDEYNIVIAAVTSRVRIERLR